MAWSGVGHTITEKGAKILSSLKQAKEKISANLSNL
jgi:hypothetical protein